MPAPKVHTLSLFIFLLLLNRGHSQSVTPRHYKLGDQLTYELTTENYYNDKLSSKTIAKAKLTVIEENGKLVEQIKWLHKIEYKGGDSTILDSIAQKVKPYNISLLPDGALLLPPLTIPEMVGEITDLNTFFVAISPKMNIGKLNERDTLYKIEKIVEGNFADGVSILKGSDCLEVTQHLLGAHAIVETSFLPPSHFCLTPILDTIKTQLFDVPNNFQMVRAAGNGMVTLMWGKEKFTILSLIDGMDGKLLAATMNNTLDLRMRVNVSPDLKTYAAEMPFKIERRLTLEWD
jgi:hypothetical protein